MENEYNPSKDTSNGIEDPSVGGSKKTVDYYQMSDYDLLNGIDEGRFTDPEALRAFIQNSLDAKRQLYHAEELAHVESEYAELIYGEPADMARFCLGHAEEYMSFDYPPALANPANPDIAARWYEMAAQVADTEPNRGGIVSQHMQPPDLSRMSPTQIKRVIETGATTDTDAVHVFARKSLETDRLQYSGDRRKEVEAQYATLVLGEPREMVRYCTQLGGSRLPRHDGLDVVDGDLGAAAQWYGMAGRFARQAAAQRRGS